jgi:hypothetical protein
MLRKYSGLFNYVVMVIRIKHTANYRSSAFSFNKTRYSFNLKKSVNSKAALWEMHTRIRWELVTDLLSTNAMGCSGRSVYKTPTPNQGCASVVLFFALHVSILSSILHATVDTLRAQIISLWVWITFTLSPRKGKGGEVDIEYPMLRNTIYVLLLKSSWR